MQQIPVAIIEAIESIQLPVMPQVLLRFLRVIDNDQAPMSELVKLVGQDPVLSARFLSISNSPALRRGAEIRHLDKCLASLGTRLMRTLAASLATQSVFARTSGDLRYNLTGYWCHSLRIAEIAREIAAHTNYSDVEEAYLSGLLLDIGQLLLLGGMGERYGVLLDSSSDGIALNSIEETSLGTNHAAVGAWLVDQWKLSSFMADAILFHHKPANEIALADPLSKIIWSARIIGDINENTDLSQENITTNLAVITSLLGIGSTDAMSIRLLCSERVSLLAATLDIVENDSAKNIPSYSTPFDCIRSKLNDSDLAYSRMEAAVRDMAMMHYMQQNLAEFHSESDILFAVRESARILFGLGRLAFLFVQPDKCFLSGRNISGQPELLQQIEVILQHDHSLAAAVALGTKPSSTFDYERPAAVSLADVQIARALGCEGILYVPMCSNGHHIGVMVFGLNASQYARIRPQLDWMASFANLVAVSIETWREQQEREQKLEAALTSRFERLARKVAHEAGNPLGIIKNYLKILSLKIPNENDIQLELNILGEEIDRVAQIVQRLSDLVETSFTPATFDINTVIEEMLTLYGESLFSCCGITLEKSLDPNLAPAAGDRDSFKQILFNLWKNGSEAMQEGGCFNISTRGGIIQHAREYIEVRLSDTGSGLPSEVLQSLFKPLDPSRKSGHLGIGLSVVASLVERLGGQIDCQSKEGEGTSFIILLPYSKVV